MSDKRGGLIGQWSRAVLLRRLGREGQEAVIHVRRAEALPELAGQCTFVAEGAKEDRDLAPSAELRGHRDPLLQVRSGAADGGHAQHEASCPAWETTHKPGLGSCEAWRAQGGALPLRRVWVV